MTIASQGVARHAGAEKPLRGKRVGVILYSYYATDPRPRRETETLVKAGMEAEVLCLRSAASMPSEEVIDGVRVFRAPLQRKRASKFIYLMQYGTFFYHSFMFLSRRSFRKRFDLIHVHNMPDFLVFAAVIPKLLGAKILLDLHDPMPELMTALFGLRPDSSQVKVVKLLEKASIALADHVLTVNKTCRTIFIERSCRPDKMGVVMNSPDPAKFPFQPAPEQPPATWRERFVLMYHGSIVKRNGLDLAIKCLPLLREKIPQIELRIFGARTEYLDESLQEARALGVEKLVKHVGERTPAEIAVAIRECDLGVISNARSLFTEINTPTRIFEYLSQGKPVMAPRSQGITDYFGPDELFYFELGDMEDLARGILRAYSDPLAAQAVLRRGQAVYLRHNWEQEEKGFLAAVKSMIGAKV